jgi:SAM-dependent methyltransferase
MSVDERFHAYQRRVEDWHWWYRVRRDILADQVARLRLDPARARILDVGCGTGGASLVLSRFGRVTALDDARASFTAAMDRPYAHRVVARFGEPLPFADGAFDVVCALDVIEHIDDDRAGARELYRVCKPGGAAIVFVPAFQFLWGYNDDFSHHRRRYTRAGLKRCLSEVGFAVEEAGYFDLSLFLPTLAARMLQRLMPRATSGMEHAGKPGALNDALTGIFRLELPLLRRAPLPVGTSSYAVARRA